MISLYQQRLNLDGCTFSRLDHDDAIVAVVYRVIQPNNNQLILKICSRSQDYFREIYYLNYFKGVLPVARIINVVEPEANIQGAILMECFPGSLLQTTSLNEELAYELGSLLAHIHLNRALGYGDLTEPQHLSPDPRVYFTNKFEEGFEECQNHLPTDLLEQCRRYFDGHISLLTSVDGPCIIHRDFRPGNIIVNKGKLLGIIDWASGRASFAEEDFCPLGLGEWSIGMANKKSFLKGYSSIRPLPDYKAIMPLLQLNRTIATIGFTVKHGTWKERSSRLYNINREFLQNFFKDKGRV